MDLVSYQLLEKRLVAVELVCTVNVVDLIRGKYYAINVSRF